MLKVECVVHQTQQNEVESKKFAFSYTVLEYSSIANSYFQAEYNLEAGY